MNARVKWNHCPVEDVLEAEAGCETACPAGEAKP
jgi:hypothetical protein